MKQDFHDEWTGEVLASYPTLDDYTEALKATAPPTAVVDPVEAHALLLYRQSMMVEAPAPVVVQPPIEVPVVPPTPMPVRPAAEWLSQRPAYRGVCTMSS